MIVPEGWKPSKKLAADGRRTLYESTCECGTTIYERLYVIKKTGRKYCRSCAHKHRMLNRSNELKEAKKMLEMANHALDEANSILRQNALGNFDGGDRAREYFNKYPNRDAVYANRI